MMTLGEFQKKTKWYRCERCGYEWLPRTHKETSLPVTCASCGSPYWNKPRTNKPSSKEQQTKK